MVRGMRSFEDTLLESGEWQLQKRLERLVGAQSRSYCGGTLYPIQPKDFETDQ
jgi:hypothetical protein